MKLLFLLVLPFIVLGQSKDNPETLLSNTLLFHNFGNNLLHSITYKNGICHLSAILTSYGLVESGVDWEYYEIMRKNKSIGYSFFPAVIIGGIAPIAVPLYLYFTGQSEHNSKLVLTSYALGQAVIISYFTSSGYKAITGRDEPQIFEDKGNRSDYSKKFNFGFFENGIFHGWPSGHTTTAVAMAVTLMELYPDNKTIQTGAILYGAFIGIGISTNIHWFSDFFAGTLIGYSIGKTVGKSFKQLMSDKTNRENFSISPTLNGISLQYSF